jgi:hypothetical protein
MTGPAAEPCSVPVSRSGPRSPWRRRRRCVAGLGHGRHLRRGRQRAPRRLRHGAPPPSAPTARSRRWSPTACSIPATPRSSPGGPPAPLPAGQELAVDLSSQPGAPHPTAAMLNVTVTDPVAAGFVRAYPCGSVPANSTVNSGSGRRRPTWPRCGCRPTAGCASGRWWRPTSSSTWPGGTRRPRRRGQPPPAASPTRRSSRCGSSTPAGPTLAPAGEAGKLAAGQEVTFTLAGHAGFPAEPGRPAQPHRHRA